MDNSSDASSAAAAGFLGVFFVFYMIFILAIIAFSIWLYWRIFSKAGYNGALSLLNLVPGVGPLICVCILAFGKWPIEEQLIARGGTLPSAGGSAPVSTV